jgi:hypothetical protein
MCDKTLTAAGTEGPANTWRLLLLSAFVGLVYAVAAATGEPAGERVARASDMLARRWLLVGPLLAAYAIAVGGRAWRWAAVYAFVDVHLDLLLIAPWPQSLLGRVGRWNWGGKGLTVVGFVVAMAAWRGLSARELGLRLPDRPGWWKLWVVLFALGALVPLAFRGRTADWSAEALAFQLTMPGLQEEATFRGLYLALVAAACGPGRLWLGLRWGWPVVVTTFHFAACHAAQPGAVGFDWGWGAKTAGYGFLYWLVRERSGSIWPAVALHNLTNATPILAAAI